MRPLLPHNPGLKTAGKIAKTLVSDVFLPLGSFAAAFLLAIGLLELLFLCLHLGLTWTGVLK